MNLIKDLWVVDQIIESLWPGDRASQMVMYGILLLLASPVILVFLYFSAKLRIKGVQMTRSDRLVVSAFVSGGLLPAGLAVAAVYCLCLGAGLGTLASGSIALIAYGTVLEPWSHILRYTDAYAYLHLGVVRPPAGRTFFDLSCSG